MGRLPPEEAVAEVIGPSDEPNVFPFPAGPISVIGRLAARESGAAFASIVDATEKFEWASLGNVALFTLRAPTLGMVAFPGQTLIASLSAEVRNGDFAVIRSPRKTYARRVGIDKSDLSRIALETMPSTSPKVPPTYFVQRSNVTLHKIVGVLFDETVTAKSQDEAVPATQSATLTQVIAAAVVVGDSAFPVAVDKGHVLLGRAPDLSQLGGRIVAAVTRADADSSDYFAYLKRLGKRMPGSSSVFYLENVGQSGEGEFVQFASMKDLQADIPIVEDVWKVLGTIF